MNLDEVVEHPESASESDAGRRRLGMRIGAAPVRCGAHAAHARREEHSAQPHACGELQEQRDGVELRDGFYAPLHLLAPHIRHWRIADAHLEVPGP
jgi:hypothetical protein